MGRVSSYLAFPPLPQPQSGSGGISLLHLSEGHPWRALPVILALWSPDFPHAQPFGSCPRSFGLLILEVDGNPIALGIFRTIHALILAFFLEIHKVFLQKNAFIMTRILSKAALGAGITGNLGYSTHFPLQSQQLFLSLSEFRDIITCQSLWRAQ